MYLVGDQVSSLLSSPTSLLATAVLLLVFYLVSSSLSPGGMEKGPPSPPGPRPLPLLGNMLQLDLKRPYRTLCELAEKYGSVFTVYFGPQRVVVLAGYKTVKEALVNFSEEFGDRYVSPLFHEMTEDHGIIFANGESWKEMRRFALSTLKDFGMGRRAVEEKIVEECRFLIQQCEKHQGKPFCTATPTSYAMSNIISSLVFGSRFEYNDPRFQTMVKRSCENIHLTGTPSVQLYNMFPRLMCWVKNRLRVLKNTQAAIRDMNELNKHLSDTLNPNSCRGLVDCFMLRKAKDEDSNDMDSHYNQKNLLYVTSNLFSAGTDTSAHTLRWSLLFMAKYPHMQESTCNVTAMFKKFLFRVHSDQVQEELSRVVGTRQIRVEERKNLPYTDAVVHETQRLSNIAPMSLPHETSRDVTFQGYFIKAGTIVFPLLTSVLYDESEWETPHTFNPSHFLDKEGKFMKRDAFMPFSAGRRSCPGESLAKMEIFIFFASLLQRFRFTPPPGVREDDLDLTPAVGSTLSPSPHELCAVSRQ